MKNWLAACLMMVIALPALGATGSNAVTIISYHDVIDLVDTQDQRVYPQTLTRNRLIEQFNLIVDLGFHPVSFQQILDAEAGKQPLPEKAILLTFDDGYRSVYDIVFPLLKLYEFPAVIAPVGSWMAVPADGKVNYGKREVPRERFLSWDQLRELHASPLIEVASHSYDLHHGVIGNPFGNLLPAAATVQWSPDSHDQNFGYENSHEYEARLFNDLKRASEQLKSELGQAPRIMFWPYGAYSEASVGISARAGMPHTFTLLPNANSLDDGTAAMGRYLVEQETSLETFEEYLAGEIWQREAKRVVHVDLDYVYDPDKQQQRRNLDLLLDRIKEQGISTVYLQAYADSDGDGVAEALYFPNRHMPVREDLFNRVAWQLKKRSLVEVYAWMPVMAFDMGSGYEYVSDIRAGMSNPDYYRRLSPYSSRNREIIGEVYEDLGLYTKFDGLLFHDDALLNDFEDASVSAQQWYREQWNLPRDILEIRRNEALMSRWSQQKAEFLIDFTLELAEQADHYRMKDGVELQTARNLYAKTILEPESERWFAQNLQAFSEAYNFTAVMAMPYMEGAENADSWLENLARLSLEKVPSNRLLFELQAIDWRTQEPVPSQTLARWMDIIRKSGIVNYGYYPDDFIDNHPVVSELRRSFSLNSQVRRR